MRKLITTLAPPFGLGAAIALGLGFWPEQPTRYHLVAPLAAGAVLGAALAWRRRSPGPLYAVLMVSVVGTALGLGLWIVRDARPRAPSVRDALVPATWTGSAHEVLAHFRSRPPQDLRSLPGPQGDELVRRADLVLADTHVYFQFPEVALPSDLAWDEDPLRDNTWQWTLHTMPFVAWLTERWRVSSELRYLQRAESFVFDWIEDNLRYLWRPPSRMSWHDHATALRLRAWLPFWEAWVRSPLADAGRAQKLLGGIVYHCRRLEDETFYTFKHNHGMEQDIALIAAASAFPELRESGRWLQLGTRRLLEQIRGTISAAGVHLEHSPGYHLQIIEVLTHLQDFAHHNDVLLPGLDLDALLARMSRVAAYLIQPDGYTVPVGDTTHEPPQTLEDPTHATQAARDPVLRFALTGGREGTPGERALVLQEDGYAIFRDWPAGPDATRDLYLFFMAAAHQGCAHKQADDLSIHLHARGRELIADPGHFSYDEKDPMRQYVTRSPAHSTVLVGGQGFSGFTARIDGSAVIAAGAAVDAHHDNYAGLRHRRTLLIAWPRAIFVVDELTPRGDGAAAERSFEQRFQLGIGLEVARAGDRLVTASVAGQGEAREEVLRLTALGAGAGTAAIHTGENEPLRGWVSRGHRVVAAAPQVAFQAKGERAVFATWIEVVAPAPAAPTALPAAEVTVEEARIRCRWPEDGRLRWLTLERRGALALTIDSP